MFHLTVSLFFFFLSVVVHILICRGRKTAELQVKLFCAIALGFLLLCWVVFRAAWNVWRFSLPISSTVIYLLLIPVYLSFYVNTKFNSPSKMVMVLLRANGTMDYEELLRHFTNEEFVVSRLDDLVKSGCVEEKDGRYRLMTQGRWTAKILEVYQKVLGREMGG